MGGVGSGRPPNPETLIKAQQQNPIITGPGDFFIPNYSGLQAVKKTDPAINGSGINNVVEDTTPQLGGDLDMNGFDILGTTNDRIKLTTNIPTATASGLLQLKFNDGEVKNKAKAIIAYVDEGDNEVIWLQSHDWLNDSTQHKHFSIEAADSTGAKQTRLSVSYGVDTAVVNVNAADFYVAGSGGTRTIDSDFDGILKMTPYTTFDVYPQHQSSRALRIDDNGADIAISALGTSYIQLSDNINSTQTLSGSIIRGSLGNFSSTLSASTATITTDSTTSGSAICRNILIGTETSPGNASNWTQGTIYMKYTA